MLQIAQLDELALPEMSALAADLVYCTDAQPGISRVKRGKGFAYVGPNGAVKDAATLARIRALVIPPAWTDVWISPNPEGHIQATGRDQRGRKQYRYHARWMTCRDEVKFTSLIEFAESLPRLRRRLARDMARKGLDRERVVATVVWLLDNAMIRIGNAAYARDNESFGLTTLRNEHVRIRGQTLRFAFRGKSGKDWNVEISNPRLASFVRRIQELPGQHLFQYLDDSGAVRTITSEDVNAYIRAIAGDRFSSKHFRTWGGSVAAMRTLSEIPRPETKTAANRALNAAVDRVAGKLGNTRAVCRKCYIHPFVLESWAAGELAAKMTAARGRMRKTPAGLTTHEATLLACLKAEQKKLSALSSRPSRPSRSRAAERISAPLH